MVLPAFNEAITLESVVNRLSEQLQIISGSYEIVIAEDGSSDGTDRIAANLSRRHAFVKHIHGTLRSGKGAAIKRGFSVAEGEILVFTDVDLVADMRDLALMVNAIRSGYDLATGSRLLPSSHVERSLNREIASRTYNMLVRMALNSPVRDHQCGLKAFRKQSYLELQSRVRDSQWFWDTEILVYAHRLGYRIFEFPISWREGSDTKFDLLYDPLAMIRCLIRFRLRLFREGL